MAALASVVRLGRLPRVSRWDAVVFVRAAALAGVALTLAWLITAVTDEGGVPWGERAGRTLPLAPICAAIGAWGALGPVRARGEVRAMEALGRSLAEISAPAVAGGAALALAAAIAVGSVPAVDAAGFYPTALRQSAWVWEGDGFVDHGRGLAVDAEGTPHHLATPLDVPPVLTIPRGGRLAAALATALAGLALPMLLAQGLLARRSVDGERRALASAPGRKTALWPILAGTAVALGASVILFQTAAARLTPAVLAALPPALLLGFAAWRYREA
jgi:hypothetical protein